MPNYNARPLLAWSDAWKSEQVNGAITEALIPSLQEGASTTRSFGRVQESRREEEETKRWEGELFLMIFTVPNHLSVLCRRAQADQQDLLSPPGGVLKSRHDSAQTETSGGFLCPHETLVDRPPVYRPFISPSPWLKPCCSLRVKAAATELRQSRRFDQRETAAGWRWLLRQDGSGGTWRKERKPLAAWPRLISHSAHSDGWCWLWTTARWCLN